MAAFAASDDTVTARTAGDPVAGMRADAHLVSGNYFTVLGVEPELGRVLTIADDQADGPPVAIVSDRFWRHALRADPAVVGSTLVVNKMAVTVIGVTRFEIRVKHPATTHSVSLAQLRRWVEGIAVSPNETLKRRKLRTLLAG